MENKTNPIIDPNKFDDLVIYGQKTLHSPVSIERMNVRRLCFYLDKRLRKFAYEKRIPGRSPKEIADLAFPNIEQFVEDIHQRKGFATYALERQDFEETSEVVLRFKPKADSDEITFTLTVKPYEEEGF